MPTKTSESFGLPLLPHQFITKIVHDADTGWGFVPLIGSGLSRPSGIITGYEFTNYLAFTTYLVLCDPLTRARTHGESRPARWNLVTQGWPPQPNQQELTAARNWILREFEAMCRRLHIEPNYDGTDKKRIKSLTVRTPVTPSQGLVSVLMHPAIPAILASEEQLQADDRMRRLSLLLMKSNGMPQPATFAVDELMSDFTRSHAHHILEMGIRALHDWRETLQFLACTEVLSAPDRLSFSHTVNRSIIDSFNSTITRDRQPNLAHKMLVHLSGALRIHTILTTNFDTLTEDAFQQLSVRIRVLPVSSRGSLPNARTVATEDTLVKLHGEAHDTRADLSLDDEPSDTDIETFADYLTRGGPYSTIDEKVESRRLLVLGYSGSDYRCIQMIKRWLESAADRPIIYWICFSQSDVRRVQNLFGSENYRGRLRITQTTRPDLLLYELYQRLQLSLPPGGLSYEFAHVLPPSRNPMYAFPEQSVRAVMECVRETKDLMEASRLIIGHQGRLEDVRALARDAMVATLAARLTGVLAGNPYDVVGPWRPLNAERTPSVVRWEPWYRQSGGSSGDSSEKQHLPGDFLHPVVVDAVGGVVRACAIAAEKASSEHGLRIFWMETVDYIDVDGMIRDFFRSLAHRFGVFQGQHVSLHPLSMPLLDFVRSERGQEPNWRKGAETIAKHLRETLAAYRVDACLLRLLIYGRDGYGTNAGLLPAPWQDPMQTKAMHCFIEALGSVGIQVVYLPLLQLRSNTQRARANRISSHDAVPTKDSEFFDSIVSADRDTILDSQTEFESKLHAESSSVYLDNLNKILHRFAKVTKDENGVFTPIARRHAGQDGAEKYLVFLYALCLFRHSRHPNALCSEATFQCPFRHNLVAADNDFIRAEEASVWIAQLRDAGLFLDKPGGAAWMFADLKAGLLSAIEQLEDIRFLFSAKPAGESQPSPRRGHQKAVEMRARLHFWIGDWYLKAFCSSGHHLPILEAMHHQLMACCFAHQARPKYLPDALSKPANRKRHATYRHLLFLSALREATKTLHLARSSLKLWQSSPFDVSWMNESHRQLLKERLTKANFRLTTSQETNPGARTKASGAAEKRTQAISDFLRTLEDVCADLTREGGGEPRKSEFSGQRRPERNVPQKPLSAGVAPTIERISWADIDNKEKDLDELLKRVLAQTGKELHDAAIKLVENRSVNSSLVGNSVPHSMDPISVMSEAKANWKEKYAGDTRQVCSMITRLFESAFVSLRRAKLHYHAEGSVDRMAWVRATIFSNLGVDFCKHLPPSELSFDMDMRVKLHTVYSIALANLGRFFEANRHLSEAQAILSKLASSQPQDFAILCIRRAEVRLTECLWIAAFLHNISLPSFQTSADSENNSITFNHEKHVVSTYLNQLLGIQYAINLDGDLRHEGVQEIGYRSAFNRSALQFSKESVFVPPRISECLRKGGLSHSAADGIPPAAQQNLLRLYGATLDEAVSLLDQAEKLLRGNSQSSLWWIRLYTLRLRVYGMLGPLDKLAETCLMRRKYAFDQGIHENFINSLRIAGADQGRKLRTLRYFFEANQWFEGFADKPESKSRDYPLLPDTLQLATAALNDLEKESPATSSYVGAGVQRLRNLAAKVDH